MSTADAPVDEAYLRERLARARRHAVDAVARAELSRALAELDPDLAPALDQCPVCGTTGTTDRLEHHDCGTVGKR